MPEQVERFWQPIDGTDGRPMLKSEFGAWVRYSDYEKLKAKKHEPQAGVMHPVDEAFSDLAVKERNHAWEESARHARERDQAVKQRDEELRERVEAAIRRGWSDGYETNEQFATTALVERYAKKAADSIFEEADDA